MSKKRDGFTAAYNQYYTITYNAVYVKVCNADDAEDICQEVFIRFYNKMEEVRDVRKWLYGTLKLVVLEYYRKKNGDQSLNIDDVFNDISLTFVNGFRDSRIMINEAIESVQSQLDDDERMVFELVAFYNYTYKETSQHMGITMRKVEYRYCRTVEKIADYLKNKGIKDIGELL
jgi:RNA polymerase sigma factor (sigma-70 family)